MVRGLAAGRTETGLRKGIAGVLAVMLLMVPAAPFRVQAQTTAAAWKPPESPSSEAVQLVTPNEKLPPDVPPPPQVSAQAAAMIDVSSGRLLYSKNGDNRMLIASLTKIMTAIVAIENGDLSDLVKVGKNAFGKEGSSIYLRLGEEMSLENMLYGMMLRSGNDAATAIAEHIGGTVEGFAYLMNQKAAELGLENSHFVNPHGLDDKDHYSSANDLAKLTAYALKNPVFREIVKTRIKTAPNPNAQWDYIWRNKNKMLYFYEGADGVKTGYTKAAGRGLVSSATRNGQQLAVVTINAPNDWADHTALLDYGFQHFSLETVVEQGERLANTPYVPKASFRYPLTAEEKEALRLQFKPEDPGTYRYRLGIRGKLYIVVNGETVGSVDMVEEQSPEQERSAPSFRSLAGKSPLNFWHKYQAALGKVWQSLFAL